MAQPTYPVQYLGAVLCKSGVPITTASIIAKYATANCMIMKTEGVNVSINSSDAFPTVVNNQNYFETGTTLVFSKDCTLAIGKYKAIT